jgi:hypothetical protein
MQMQEHIRTLFCASILAAVLYFGIQLTERPRWEYKIEFYQDADSATALGSLGRDGWELLEDRRVHHDPEGVLPDNWHWGSEFVMRRRIE